MLELKNIGYEVEDELGKKRILNNVNLTLDERFVAFTAPTAAENRRLRK